MDFFNQITKHSLNAFFQNTSSFKLIILWGHRGGGKTYTAHSVLLENHIKTKDIIFSEDNMLPFNFQDNLESYFLDEDAILVQCSQLFRENYCLFFQNMEFCDLDSQRLLYKLIKYHKNNNQKSYVILEYNVTEKPADRLCLLSEDILFIGLPPKSDFDEYYAAHFAPSPITKELYERILKITQGNIQNFFSVIKILQYIGILCKNDQGLYFCKNSAYKMPDSLLDLYVDLFDGLKEYLREPLISTAPFSKQIYSTIIQGIYHNYDMFEEYLKILCKNGCFVTENDTVENKNSQIFQTRYFFQMNVPEKRLLPE